MSVPLLAADRAPLLARPFYRDGDPGPIVAALAHVPELLELAMPFLGAALGPSAVPWRTKEIVILRTSAQLECRFCVQSHTVVALDAGLSRDEVLALRAAVPVSALPDPGEAALVRWVDAVAAGRGPVSSQLRTDLRAHYDDAVVVEITLVVGVTLLLNRFCTALELPTSPNVLVRLATEDLV
jgi:AhpD family alkylhydroperoxidase